MQHYAPPNPSRPLASIEEILDPESKLADSEDGTPPKLLEAAKPDTEGHSVSSTVRVASTFEQHELTACKDERKALYGIDVHEERDVDGPGGRTHQYLVTCWIEQKYMDLFFELVRMSWCRGRSGPDVGQRLFNSSSPSSFGPILSPLVPELYNGPSIGN